MTRRSLKRSAKSSRKALRGRRLLVTAGPTREYFDPVRFLSNPSSGKMGYAVARAARARGARVTLVSGPTMLKDPAGVKTIRVSSAHEMHRACIVEARRADWIIMTAAVSDWRPERTLSHKVKKQNRPIRVRLVPTRDILKALGQSKKKGQLLVGFAAETERLLPHAWAKLKAKKLDAIVANRVGGGKGFEAETNELVILFRDRRMVRLPRLSKRAGAARLIALLTSLSQ